MQMKSSYNVYPGEYGTFITCKLKADDQSKKSCEYFDCRDHALPVTLEYEGLCRHFSWSNQECMSLVVREEVRIVEKIELI